MRCPKEEISLWYVLLELEKTFLQTIATLETEFKNINDQNVLVFNKKVDLVANYVRFFACFQTSATFTCKDEIPPGTCFYGINNLVTRCEAKLTEFLGARLTFGSNKNFAFCHFFAITSKFRSFFDYNKLKDQINKPQNRIVIKALHSIPLYKKIISLDGNHSLISQDFVNNVINLKFDDSIKIGQNFEKCSILGLSIYQFTNTFRDEIAGLKKRVHEIRQHNVVDFLKDAKNISENFIVNGYMAYVSKLLNCISKTDALDDSKLENFKSLTKNINLVLSDFSKCMENSSFLDFELQSYRKCILDLFHLDEISNLAHTYSSKCHPGEMMKFETSLTVNQNIETPEIDVKLSPEIYLEISEKLDTTCPKSIKNEENDASKLIFDDNFFLNTENKILDDEMFTNNVENDNLKTALTPFCHWDTLFNNLNGKMKIPIFESLGNITKILTQFSSRPKVVEDPNCIIKSNFVNSNAKLFYVPHNMNPEILDLINKLLDSSHIKFSYSTNNQRFVNSFSELGLSNIGHFSNYDKFIVEDYCSPNFSKDYSSLDADVNDRSLHNLITSKINNCSNNILKIYDVVTASAAMLNVLQFKVETYEKTAIPDSEILSLLLSDNPKLIHNCDRTTFSNYFIKSALPIFRQVFSVTLVTKKKLKKVAKIVLCWNCLNPHYLAKLWFTWKNTSDAMCAYQTMAYISINMSLLVSRCVVRNGFGINVASKMGQYSKEVRHINCLQSLLNLRYRPNHLAGSTNPLAKVSQIFIPASNFAY